MHPVTKSVVNSLIIAGLNKPILTATFRRLIWRMFLLFIFHLTTLLLVNVIYCPILGWILHMKVTFVPWLVAWQQESQISCSPGNAEDHVTTTGTVNPHHGQLYVTCTGAWSAQDVYVYVSTQHIHDAVQSRSALHVDLPQAYKNFIWIAG